MDSKETPPATTEPSAPTGAVSPRAALLAWGVSFALHVALFTTMFLLPWLSDIVGQTDELPIAHTDLLGELTEARLVTDTTPDLAFEPETANPESLQVTPKRFDNLVEQASAARPELSIIGVGTGGGEDFGKFGLRSSSGGPGPEFFGLGKRARGAHKIVYVVDRSGSMMTTFQAVRNELQNSVDGLRRNQKFHVIFFNAGPPLENRPKTLVPATAVQKRRLFEFLETIHAEGSTDPIPAMERAFAVKPDLIYFLTDGDFDPALLEKLRTWNKNHEVRVYTFAYVSEQGRILLEQIAREHDGEFKFISEHDIL